ncbi:MAG: hypothetical protein ACREHG_10710 [Candidatus Saccharimonadales bacterium]
MARTTRHDTVCDVCGTAARVDTWTLVNPDAAAVVIDLCPGDAKPLARLFGAGAREPRKKKATRRERATHRVVPVD